MDLSIGFLRGGLKLDGNLFLGGKLDSFLIHSRGGGGGGGGGSCIILGKALGFDLGGSPAPPPPPPPLGLIPVGDLPHTTL